uniref:Signal recognition particle subunit SRP72 n=1 Tax=Hirondellea gigas TaxID=1518452 RepID=A0A2P2HYF5_9CRUS
MAHNIKNVRIQAAYAELKKLIDQGSYSRIIKTTNKIVNDDQSQPEAWQCKVVAYIQLDQFKEAINAINKAPNRQQMQFELAYSQYRLNKVAAAIDTLDSAPDKDSPRGKELRAQILYRLEQHSECYTVYRELLRTTADDMDMERTTNMAAVQVHRVELGQCPVPSERPTASYEQWYNSGCAAAAAGEAQQALHRLSEAMKQCEALLQEEGASDEELQQEQAIIRVQRGYVLQCQGREKEAAAEYGAVLQNTKLEDPALLAILHNNMAVTNRDATIFDTRKKLKPTQISELEHKLTSAQRSELALNNCILAYNAQQPLQEDSTIEHECEKLLSSGVTSMSVKGRAVLLLAASRAKAGKLEEAVAGLQRWAGANQQHASICRLAAAQLRLMKGDVSGGISEFSALPPSELYRPGIVASIVTLLLSRKQKPAVTKLFKDAANWHQNNKSGSSKSVEQLLRRAAEYHMKEGDPQSAAAALEQLRDSSTEAAAACLPSLIHAYSQFDSSAAQALSRDLPDTVSSSTGLDADVLEASLGPKYFQKAAHKTDDKEAAAVPGAAADKAMEGGAAVVGAGGRVKTRKKKRRKTVLPKNYIEGVVPDPERWLPRWQRKGVPGGKRRRDKRKDVGRGTQGGLGDTADKYDISKNPGQFKSSSSIQQQPEPAGPRRNMPKKKTNRKK